MKKKRKTEKYDAGDFDDLKMRMLKLENQVTMLESTMADLKKKKKRPIKKLMGMLGG